MAVQFITGPAGSGKSTYVMQTVAEQLKKNPRKKIILMVPEQATFCYQYELITQYGINGVLTLEILSFQRLARTVMQAHGGLARQNIDELGKLLILRRILQQEDGCYPYLSRSVNRPGYLMKIGETIQEMKRYQISSGLLQRTIEENALPQTVFGSKLQELSALYSGYDAFLSNEYLDSEEMLNILLQCLDDTDLFRDTEIWVDEFYDFTPQEYAILGKLMKCAANVHIVLPMDQESDNPGRKAVFHSITASYHKLRSIAQEHHVSILPDYVFSQPIHRDGYDDLYALEQQYFAIGNINYDKPVEHITLIQGQNRLSEVDYAARTIRRICREEGYRYQEIGIFTRGEQYQLLLETVLNDYDIPYFIDHKETVQQHPLTEFLLSAFEIVQNRWNYQSVFRFLKCGLLPFDFEQIDLLENYVLQYGIKGGTWYRTEPWNYGFSAESEDQTVQQIDRLRREIAGSLYQFEQAIQGEHTASELITAIYAMMEAYQVPAQLERMCSDAMTHQLLEAAQIHQQIWEKIIHIFDQMSHLLQDTMLSANDFSVILQSAVQNLDLGLLPSSLDQVFVGALAHSRARNLKVVFVLGLNEGVFPAKTSQDGFFNDLEKHILRDMGVVLSPDSTEQIYDEQFLIYLALTRASEKLYFSYSLCDEEGKALRPSTITDKLHRIFPQLKEQTAQWPPDETCDDLLPYFSHRQKSLGLLGGHLTQQHSGKYRSEKDDIWADLYRWFEEHPDDAFVSVKNSLTHASRLEACQLSNTELFGSPMRLSVSALEKYRQCPYGYFLRYGLRLQERKLYQMEAVDTGAFYHTAIEQFSNYLLEHQISWHQLDKDKVKAIMTEIVDNLAPKIQNEILMSSGRYQYIRRRLHKTLERSALMLMEHGQRGDFVPVAVEAGFGTQDSVLPGWKIVLQDGTSMYLQGRIDRIEQAKYADTTYLRVIDFKSGKQGLDFSEIYYGLKIQLLTYLNVALRYYANLLPDEQQLMPAGVLYYFLKSGIVSTDGPMNANEAEALHQNKLRADGLLLADMHALKLAERDLDTGASTLLPLSLLTKAAPYIEDPDSFDTLEDPMELFGKRNRTVVSREQMQWLLDHTVQIIAAMGEEIHKGNIAIRPCRIRQFTGCKYCDYQAICQIQTIDFEKNCEELIPLKPEELWQRLSEETKEQGTKQRGGADNAAMDKRTTAGH